jgi:hypothetical protein
MLFDLQGKRRRVVQATYLTLAVLMGGGLVLFGIGSDATGGLADIFGGGSGGGGGGDGNQATEDRIDHNEELVAKGGAAREKALKELVRDYYALATSQTPSGATSFPEETKDELKQAAVAWQRYLKVEQEKPDRDTANFALQIYDPAALNDPKEAQEAAQIIANADNDWQSYVGVVGYATLAGDTRTADLAGQKAIDLAKKGEKKEVRAAVEQAKSASTQAPAGTTAPGG